MAVNIDMNQETVKGKFTESRDLQFVPCKIEYDGKADIDKFFNGYIREENSSEEGGDKSEADPHGGVGPLLRHLSEGGSNTRLQFNKLFRLPPMGKNVPVWSTPVLRGTLRGYPLSGCTMDTPEGYTGVVLKETRPTINAEEDRTMRVVSQFKQFTYWNWDRDPSRGDKYQQAMDWADIAGVIHGTD